MSWLRRWWAQTAPAATWGPGDTSRPDIAGPRTARDWTVDVAAVVLAVVLGAVTLSITVDDYADRMTSGQIAVDAVFGVL